MGFPGDSVVKDGPTNAGDAGSVPGLGRSPGEGNSNLLQYSWLENSMHRGDWQATVHGIAKESDTAEQLSMHTHTHFYISNSESVRIRFSWEWQKSSNHHVVSNMLWFSHVSTISESKWSRLPSWFCSKSLEQNFATDYYVLSRLLSFFHGPRQTTWHQNWQSKQLPLPTKSHGEGREEIKIYRISKITQTIQKATLRGKCLYMG